MSPFEDNVIECDHPSIDRIREVYRELPRCGGIRAVVEFKALSGVLSAAEQAGFFGLTLEPMASSLDRIRVTAWKGKAGPCYNGGSEARLKGPAVAILDDDSHLVVGSLPVCVKTGTIYGMAMYRPFIDVSSGDPDLLRRLDDEPLPFDCDTFQADVERLLAKDDWLNYSDSDLVNVMYRGPFKRMICGDGSVVRRGQIVKLPKAVLADFARYDVFMHVPESLAAGTRAPLFSDAYKQAGSLCLLGSDAPAIVVSGIRPIQFDALMDCTDSMAIRLLGTIERGDSHFTLTGSRPDDEFGCCPSADVGEAMRLVDAGILEASRMPGPPDSCTSTVFAFRGELSLADGKPIFTQNADVRGKIKAFFYESRAGKKTNGIFKTCITYGLLAFVAVSLGYAATKVANGHYSGEPELTSESSLAAQLELAEGVTVVLVRNTVVCDSCETARSWCISTVDKHSSTPDGKSQIHFHETTWEAPGLRPLLRKHDVIETVTILVVNVVGGKDLEVTDLSQDFWRARSGQEQFSEKLDAVLTNHLMKTPPP